MKNKVNTKLFYLLGLLLVAGLSFACQAPAPTTNTETEANTANVNAETANDAGETSPAGTNLIETSEPETYQATVSLSAETEGETKTATPKLIAKVARDGANRRMEFNMPNGEKIIYLTVGDEQYIVAPARKQYAELDKELLGVDVRKLMTPDQIVNQVKALQGVKRVGEEKYNGRDVVKYTFAATTETATKAGEVETESFVLVDKETNLPIRSVTNIQSESGKVQGVSGLKIVNEISDIQTEVDESLFKKPEDFEKVEAEEVRKQVKAFFDTAQILVQQVLRTNQPAGK